MPVGGCLVWWILGSMGAGLCGHSGGCELGGCLLGV